MGQIIHIQPQEVQSDIQLTTIEAFRERQVRRRKLHAKRMAIKYPLFAVQFAQKRYPDYDVETFESDIKGKKRTKYKKGKSQLNRQGRYPLMRESLSKYQITKDPKHLHEAQKWRKKLFLPFEVYFKLNGKKRIITLPSTTSIRTIKDLAAIKFESWEDLDEILEDKLRYAHVN